MKDIEVKISKESRMVYLSKSKIGIDKENLQANLVFSFKDEFVNGQARLEMTYNGEDSWIPLLKEEETYYCPLKSAITNVGKTDMQLVITENENEDGIPIFKSNVFYVYCDKAINAEIEQPEEYPTWIEIANEKLNEMDNLDIDATKVGDTATITITKKDGTEQSIEITDGQTGPQGPKGDPGAIKMQVVQTLPATGAEDTIYLVPSTDPATQNLYDEYIYTNNAWEKIGNTSVDLSDYATKEDVEITIGGETFYTNQTWADFLFQALQSSFDDIWEDLSKKYEKPSGGIPSTDLASGVIPDISGKEDKTNKVTSLSSSSTDIEYPSAKAVYDALQNVGGGENYIVNIDGATLYNFNVATIQKIIDNMLSNNLNVAYLITSTSQQKTFDLFTASLFPALNTSTTSYTLTVWRNIYGDNVTSILFDKYPYTVTITWDNDIPIVTARSIQASQENRMYLNGNTANWTPNTDYSPAHKKYVDDAIASIPVGGTSPFGPPISWDMMLSTNNPTATNYPTIFEQIRLAYNYSIENNLEDSIGLINSGSNVSFSPSRLLGFYTAKKGSKQFYCVFLHTPYKSQSSKIASLSYVNIDLSGATFDSSGKITTMINSFRISPMLFGLATDNQIAYTPTSNYNPATKKYVDDSIASAITTTLGGSY